MGEEGGANKGKRLGRISGVTFDEFFFTVLTEDSTVLSNLILSSFK
jgi:hypothetical protein